MNQVVITINLGNEACQDLRDVAVILRSLAARMEKGQEPTKPMDANGNSVGTVEYN